MTAKAKKAEPKKSKTAKGAVREAMKLAVFSRERKLGAGHRSVVPTFRTPRKVGQPQPRRLKDGPVPIEILSAAKGFPLSEFTSDLVAAVGLEPKAIL